MTHKFSSFDDIHKKMWYGTMAFQAVSVNEIGSLRILTILWLLLCFFTMLDLLGVWMGHRMLYCTNSWVGMQKCEPRKGFDCEPTSHSIIQKNKTVCCWHVYEWLLWLQTRSFVVSCHPQRHTTFAASSSVSVFILINNTTTTLLLPLQ